MQFKASVFVLMLAGIGLAGCSYMPAERSGAPQPLENSSASAAGQSAAARVGTPEAQKQESAFRQLDTNHDGLIDRQEFEKLKLM
jgi:trimethylamine:corrinoid methyltransferase-like protein